MAKIIVDLRALSSSFSKPWAVGGGRGAFAIISVRMYILYLKRRIQDVIDLFSFSNIFAVELTVVGAAGLHVTEVA